MKNPYIVKSALLVVVAVAFGCNFAVAQSGKEEKALNRQKNIATAIEKQDYIFKAQSILPTSGFSRQLNGDYDLQVNADKVVSFLPYMGRIYTPPIDPSDGPLRFTSTNFAYMEQPQKKGGWNISIKPKDVRSVREFTLSVSEDGYATLQVSGNDRQPVTFYGYVIENG